MAPLHRSFLILSNFNLWQYDLSGHQDIRTLEKCCPQYWQNPDQQRWSFWTHRGRVIGAKLQSLFQYESQLMAGFHGWYCSVVLIKNAIIFIHSLSIINNIVTTSKKKCEVRHEYSTQEFAHNLKQITFTETTWQNCSSLFNQIWLQQIPSQILLTNV